MFKLKRLAFVALLGMSITAHAQITSQNAIGNMVGGLIGGAIGSKVGQGNGRAVAIIGGTMLGTYVGDRMTSRDQPDARTYNQQTTYQQPVRQQSRTVMNSREAATSYANNEVIPYEEPRSQRVSPSQGRQARQSQERGRFEKYHYTVQGESGNSIKMVGCAAYDDQERASRPVDMHNCDSQQTSYVTE